MLVMMTYIHWQLAIRSFSLITQVPERVIRWFGQGGENLGEDRDSDRTTAILVGAVQKMEGMGRGTGVAGRRAGPGAAKGALDTAAQGADGTGGGAGNKVPT